MVRTPWSHSACSAIGFTLVSADALFELYEAILTASRVPSPPHLSLLPVRHGWNSLYAALRKGGKHEEGLAGPFLGYFTPSRRTVGPG